MNYKILAVVVVLAVAAFATTRAFADNSHYTTVDRYHNDNGYRNRYYNVSPVYHRDNNAHRRDTRQRAYDNRHGYHQGGDTTTVIRQH